MNNFISLKRFFDDLAKKEVTANKGQPNGYTPLDSSAKVPFNYLPDSLLGAMHYAGIWDVSTNTPTLIDPPGTGIPYGSYYPSSSSGNFAGLTFKTKDWLVNNNGTWAKIDNASAVVSVFGRDGIVAGMNGDYSASLITNDSSVLGATVKDALDTLTNAATGVVPPTPNTLAQRSSTGTLKGADSIALDDLVTRAQLLAAASGLVQSTTPVAPSTLIYNFTTVLPTPAELVVDGLTLKEDEALGDFTVAIDRLSVTLSVAPDSSVKARIGGIAVSGGTGSGIVPPTPDTIAQRGSTGTLKAATAVAADDLVTLAQLQAAASGLVQSTTAVAPGVVNYIFPLALSTPAELVVDGLTLKEDEALGDFTVAIDRLSVTLSAVPNSSVKARIGGLAVSGGAGTPATYADLGIDFASTTLYVTPASLISDGSATGSVDWLNQKTFTANGTPVTFGGTAPNGTPYPIIIGGGSALNYTGYSFDGLVRHATDMNFDAISIVLINPDTVNYQALNFYPDSISLGFASSPVIGATPTSLILGGNATDTLSFYGAVVGAARATDPGDATDLPTAIASLNAVLAALRGLNLIG